MFTSPILFFVLLVILLFFVPHIYRHPKWGVLLLIFLLPFERIPSWNMPLEWGITLRLSQVVGLILVVAFIGRLATRRINWLKLKGYLKNPVIISILAYLLVALLSVGWAVDREKALLVTGFTFFTGLCGFLVFFWFNSKNMLPKIEQVFFWAVLIVSLFGIYQFMADTFNLSIFWSGLLERYTKIVLGFPRVQSTALEPLFLVNFLLIPFGLFSALFLTKQSQLSSRRLVSILILIVITLVLAVARGGYLASIILLISVVIFLARSYSWRRLAKFLGIILIGLVLAGLLIVGSSRWSYGNSSGLDKLLAHSSQITTEQRDNLAARSQLWSWAFRAFKEQPITGVGVGNFGSWMGEQGYPWRQRTVNNEPLEILAETGILGAVPIVMMTLLIIFGSIKSFGKSNPQIKPWLAGFLVALVAIWAQYMTFSTLYITHFWVLIGLLLALQRLAGKHSGDSLKF
jgi:O-antigen ligase